MPLYTLKISFTLASVGNVGAKQRRYVHAVCWVHLRQNKQPLVREVMQRRQESKYHGDYGIKYHTYGSCQISPHLRTRHSSPSVPILLLLRLYLHGLHLHTTHQHASKSIVIVNLAQFWLKLLKRLFPQSHITRGQVMYINLCTTLTKEKAQSANKWVILNINDNR